MIWNIPIPESQWVHGSPTYLIPKSYSLNRRVWMVAGCSGLQGIVTSHRMPGGLWHPIPEDNSSY